MRSLLAVLMLATIALSGCSDDPEPAPEPDDGFGLQDELEASEDTGVIRGVVVNGAVQPIQDVNVQIIGTEMATTTDANGFFGFSDLDPGTYFISAQRVGYDPMQTSTDVVAGENRPPVVKLQMLADPDSRPYAVTHIFEGFLQCGTGTAGVGSTNPCFLGTSDNVRDHPVDKPVTFAQSEMIWEGTSAVSNSLSLSYYDPNSLAGSSFKRADGGSPLTLQANQTEIEAALGGNYTEITVRVFPGTSDTVSVAFEQRFVVYTTYFYGMAPEEWSFIDDGEYPDFE